jgi:Putative metallopeptidase
MRQIVADGSVNPNARNSVESATLTDLPRDRSTFMAARICRTRICRKGYLPLLLLSLASGSAFAQQPPTHLSPPPPSSAPPGKFQPKTNIDVVYGPTEGRTTTAQQVAQSIRLLETVAEHAADEFAWPAPFSLEMQSCGDPNAHWDLPTHKLTLCYELASEFSDLYRTYAEVRADGLATAGASKRKALDVSAFKSKRQKLHQTAKQK